MTHTPESLRAFTARVAAAYETGLIHAPVHLSGGGEERLIAYFNACFHPGDWVFATWRSHYAALLAGVPEEKVYQAIIAGRSITLCWPEHRFATSAIVAGHLPIALGVAMGIKQKWDSKCKHGIFARNWCWQCDEYALHGSSEPDNERTPHVHVFCGDMAAETGTFHECAKYARNHDLLLTFIVEDNSLSVCTPTQDVWGSAGRCTGDEERAVAAKGLPIVRFTYELVHPHSGAKQRTNF